MKEIHPKGFEITVKKTYQKDIKVRISNEMEQFCQLYAGDPKFMGNPTTSYMKVYGEENPKIAHPLAQALISQEIITQRINQIIEDQGFNDQNIDKQHLFLINQHKDLPTKMKGIEHYNKLKKRTNDAPIFIMPKPIMDWDDEEPTKLDEQDVKVIETTENGI